MLYPFQRQFAPPPSGQPLVLGTNSQIYRHRKAKAQACRTQLPSLAPKSKAQSDAGNQRHTGKPIQQCQR